MAARPTPRRVDRRLGLLLVVPLIGAVAAGATFALASSTTTATSLLGFKDDHTMTEAVIAVVAEVTALGVLGASLLERRPLRTR